MLGRSVDFPFNVRVEGYECFDMAMKQGLRARWELLVKSADKATRKRASLVVSAVGSLARANSKSYMGLIAKGLATLVM